MHPAQLRAYLTQTAIHKALDEGKRAGRKREEPLGERALAEPDPAYAPDEVVSARMHSRRVREVVGELPERAQTIVKLRFYFDRTPAEIQRYLGITERAYRRELERALRELADAYKPVREGRFCESRRSLILGYVSGVAGPGRTRKAREHLSSCTACSHWAAQLRSAAERAAAALPLPPLVLHDGPFARLAGSLHGARDSLLDAGLGAKQHATSLAARLDPGAAQYGAGARPGAAVAAVAGCMALGGGAAYCVVESVPQPVRSLVGAGTERRAPEPPERPAAKPRAVTAAPAASTPERGPVRAAPAPAPKARAKAASTPAPRRKRSSERTPATSATNADAPPVVRLPADEFGFENPPQSGGSTTPPPAPAPAPAPEFGP